MSKQNFDDENGNSNSQNRREFLSTTAVTAIAASTLAGTSVSTSTLGTANLTSLLPAAENFDFVRPDSLFHGHQWQTLNPGYWKVEKGALRRRLKNYGDRARRTGFPFHGVSHGFDYKTQYDPSLASGIIYLPQWKLTGAFTIKAKFTYRGNRSTVAEGDDASWNMYQDGYGLMGVAIGAKSVFESYGKITNAWQIGWTDDGMLRMIKPGNRNRGGRQSGNKAGFEQPGKQVEALKLEAGDTCDLTVSIAPKDNSNSIVTSTINVIRAGESSSKSFSVTLSLPSKAVEGYVGIASRGLIDFEVNSLDVVPEKNKPLKVGTADCLACYPLGDTLKEVDGKWVVRFVGMFASDSKTVEIRVSDSETPDGGWQSVPVCGSAKIVNNEWRRNTAIVDVTLPINPAEKTLYYTIWKDEVDVTADGRVGTDACGPGTGLVGEVPGGGNYVGRLPQLAAPYKMCGLSCHAITQGLQQRKGSAKGGEAKGDQDNGWEMKGGKNDWLLRDQPTVEAYKHLDDYNFQIMVWEDDVWYMELVMYPPSTDDAYKIVALSICGPTSRWQMMRHWNVINPGDHDYGMDDVKGPEQIAIRKIDGLGQDASYMRRNFQIVHHLTTGAEEVDPLENPKKWRAWKMPNRDFTLIVLDSRLWRSSQDVDMWDDAGWDAFKSLYDRTDPTRSLLGEEQFGWLQEWLSTDSSPLISVTGISGLHTIWTGAGAGSKTHPMKFDQRDRVVADYAGWVKAGADRVLELFGSRDGIVSVYGDVHNGCIMKNVEQRLIECSFGPIGRSGGRGCIPGFGQKMKDVDGRELEINSLYHKTYANSKMENHGNKDPYYWNFLEMEFDPSQTDAKIGMRLRNLIDPADASPRGGEGLETTTSQTGRLPTCQLPAIKTLPNADVFFTHTNGHSIRGSRSDADGNVSIQGLVDVEPGTKIVVNAFDGEKSHSQVVVTT